VESLTAVPSNNEHINIFGRVVCGGDFIHKYTAESTLCSYACTVCICNCVSCFDKAGHLVAQAGAEGTDAMQMKRYAIQPFCIAQG
jgi:hypothetical protein